MSASGTKRTYVCALQMSAFGGKADMIQVGVWNIWREYVAVYRGVAYVGPETGGILKLIPRARG